MPSTKDSRFKPMSTPCESVDSYRPGGSHPVILGDIVHERYRIIRKLGYGSYATIWLAEDTIQIKHVALKIYAATIDVTNELSIQQRLAAITPKGLSSKSLLLLSDSSILEGPNEKHPCFVTKPTGPSILGSLPSGLKFLHDKNVAHGNLQSRNLPFPLRDISRLQDLEAVKLADFGNAFRVDNPQLSLATPLPFRALEILLRDKVDHAVDIWSFDCLMFALLTESSLFQVVGLGRSYTMYFGPNGDLLDAVPGDFDDSEMGRALKAFRPADMNDEEARELVSLLREILQIVLSNRPSAVQLLEKPWLRMW
ncbi:serine/threonine-protein kinase SRPK3 [Xylaria sp. FL1777]|nr:serine/threonine-protein kinase SRPK3 [Xylaria sp. FL1777]